MEPADLNSPTDDDARLEAMLRNAAPALPDDGFSARVLAALPDPAAQHTPWRRTVSCVVGAGAGAGFALWQGVSWPELRSGLAQLATSLFDAGPSLVAPLLGAALVVTMLSLLLAFQSELREKLMS